MGVKFLTPINGRRVNSQNHTFSRQICVDHCILLLTHLSNHMHFITNGLQRLFIDKLGRSKATCSFNLIHTNVPLLSLHLLLNNTYNYQTTVFFKRTSNNLPQLSSSKTFREFVLRNFFVFRSRWESNSSFTVYMSKYLKKKNIYVQLHNGHMTGVKINGAL